MLSKTLLVPVLFLLVNFPEDRGVVAAGGELGSAGALADTRVCPGGGTDGGVPAGVLGGENKGVCVETVVVQG